MRVVFHHAPEQRAHQVVGKRRGDIDFRTRYQAGKDDSGKEQRDRQNKAARSKLQQWRR